MLEYSAYCGYSKPEVMDRCILKELFESDFVNAYNYFAEHTDYEKWNAEFKETKLDYSHYDEFIRGKLEEVVKRMNERVVSLFWKLSIDDDLQLHGTLCDVLTKDGTIESVEVGIYLKKKEVP